MRRYKFFLLFLITIFTIPIFGCGKLKVERNLSQCISETRDNYFFAKDDTFNISFTDGKRECDYKMDGFATKLVDYGIIVLDGDFLECPSFEMQIDDKTFTGTMERNPFDGTFVFDIEYKLLNNDIDSISIYIVDIDKTFVLNRLSKNWQINQNKALTIFVDHNRTLLENFNNGEQFFGEVYIKLVADNKNLDKISWYILCVSQDGNVIASLVDVNSGEILQNIK